MIKSFFNNFCKVMLAGCVLVGVAALTPYKVEAATASASFTQIATNSLLSVPAALSSVTISASTSNAVTMYLYDTAYGSNVVSIGQYVTRTNYVTNQVSSYVTTTGVTNTFTNRVLYTAYITNAANANTPIPAAATFTVAAGEVNTFPVNLLFGQGVLVKSTTNGTINITYEPGPGSP